MPISEWFCLCMCVTSRFIKQTCLAKQPLFGVWLIVHRNLLYIMDLKGGSSHVHQTGQGMHIDLGLLMLLEMSATSDQLMPWLLWCSRRLLRSMGQQPCNQTMNKHGCQSQTHYCMAAGSIACVGHCPAWPLGCR